MTVGENDSDSELRVDAALPGKPEAPVKVGTELTEFGRQFGGVDLDIPRDPAATEPAEFVEGLGAATT